MTVKLFWGVSLDCYCISFVFLGSWLASPNAVWIEGGYIIDNSVHSQRVERLKRNTFYAITGLYYKNVQYLEEIMKWWVNEVHMGVLQHTFVPRANCALNFFADSWNAHPLSSEKNRSSEQLWILWMNIQKVELCTYTVNFILIPQVKGFHTV